MKKEALAFILVSALIGPGAALAQSPSPPAEQEEAASPRGTMGPGRGGMSPERMTNRDSKCPGMMGGMCPGMMGHGMGMGWAAMGVTVLIGVMALVALGLLIALEVVWLRHWLLRLRRERAAGSPG